MQNINEFIDKYNLSRVVLGAGNYFYINDSSGLKHRT